MTTSVFNQRRRKKRRAEKVAWKRAQRHTGGDWKVPTWKLRPNAQADTWHQNKEAR